MGRILGGTENMGRNESMAKLLMKIWEGITENRDLPNKNTGFFFKQRRVTLTYCRNVVYFLPKFDFHASYT